MAGKELFNPLEPDGTEEEFDFEPDLEESGSDIEKGVMWISYLISMRGSLKGGGPGSSRPRRQSRWL